MRNAEWGSGAPRFEGPGRSHQEGGELIGEIEYEAFLETGIKESEWGRQMWERLHHVKNR